MVRSRRTSRAALALLTTTAIAFPALARAQNAPEETIDENVIVVTAQRREERLQDVPISINALGEAKPLHRLRESDDKSTRYGERARKDDTFRNGVENPKARA